MTYALITGGSKGIGFAIAGEFAARGKNLLLIARKNNDLEQAKHKLKEKYTVEIEIFSADITDDDAPSEIYNFCNRHNIVVDTLVNNAGLGGDKSFTEAETDYSLKLIDLNIKAVVALTGKFLPVLLKQQKAYILNVASVAGFAPIPKINLYSASKSFIISYTLSLREELKNTSVKVSCLCPGPVYTKPEIKKRTEENLGKAGKILVKTPEEVAKAAVTGLLRNKKLIIPGAANKINAALFQIIPPASLSKIMRKIGEKGG